MNLYEGSYVSTFFGDIWRSGRVTKVDKGEGELTTYNIKLTDSDAKLVLPRNEIRVSPMKVYIGTIQSIDIETKSIKVKYEDDRKKRGKRNN